MTADLILGKQGAFVVAYVDNELAGGELTLAQVAIKAGIAERNAHVYASRALAMPKITQAIEARKRLLAEQAAGKIDVDAERVIQEWAMIATADPTEVVTVRRLNCRHCWGLTFAYQYTDAEYAKETAAALDAGESLEPFVGGPGFNCVGEPNPHCPECGGEGVDNVHIADLRKLKPAARRLIAGIKQGKHGIEVQFRDQGEALAKLAQWLGLLVNKNEHTGPNGGPIQTQNVNYTLPTDPQEAARAYQALMEGKTK